MSDMPLKCKTIIAFVDEQSVFEMRLVPQLHHGLMSIEKSVQDG